MSRRAAVALALLAPLGAGVQAADAATVSTPERCYSSREPVDYVGTEFRPGATFKVFLGGRQVDTGRVSTFGDLAGDFKAPVPDSRPAGERTFTLTVTDGQRRATTRFRSTKFGADYRPDREIRRRCASGSTRSTSALAGRSTSTTSARTVATA